MPTPHPSVAHHLQWISDVKRETENRRTLIQQAVADLHNEGKPEVAWLNSELLRLEEQPCKLSPTLQCISHGTERICVFCLEKTDWDEPSLYYDDEDNEDES